MATQDLALEGMMKPDDLVGEGELRIGAITITVLLNDDGEEHTRFETEGDLRCGALIGALEVTKMMIYESMGTGEVEI